MPRKTLSRKQQMDPTIPEPDTNGDSVSLATLAAPEEPEELSDDANLFPELDASAEHKDILEQARLLKAKKIAASKAKDKRDEVEDHLMEMMLAAGLTKGFKFDGVTVKYKPGKPHLSVRTARKEDPGVEAAGDDPEDE